MCILSYIYVFPSSPLLYLHQFIVLFCFVICFFLMFCHSFFFKFIFRYIHLNINWMCMAILLYYNCYFMLFDSFFPTCTLCIYTWLCLLSWLILRSMGFFSLTFLPLFWFHICFVFIYVFICFIWCSFLFLDLIYPIIGQLGVTQS